MSFLNQEFAGLNLSGAVPAVSAPAAQPPDRGARYETSPAWMTGSSTRRWESAETDRLNEAHWLYAADESLNAWLAAQLPTLRARAVYETKNNGTILGMMATHADDIVGPDGPTLQVQSDDPAYNEALERVWRQWFYSPTHLPNLSGASLIKGWIKSLWKCGAFLARMFTDDQAPADSPVKMRLRPLHPRRLNTPAELSGNPRVFMGVEYDGIGRPVRYWIRQQDGIGTGMMAQAFDAVPAADVVYEYIREEEDQGAGVPWLASGLQTAADLRDYDDQVQDAARLMADSAVLLYTRSTEVPAATMPESTTYQRRTIRMAPPAWEPWSQPATQPPAQYPEYRGEKQADLGRPVSMPKLLVRMDASKHSWASARMDIDGYRRAGSCFQAWLSGSEKSAGVLNRLVDEVAREARFSVRELRNRPPVVLYHWGWPQLNPVEPDKLAKADEITLGTRTRTLTEILGDRKKTLDQHVEELRREEEAFEAAGITKPQWMKGQQQAQQQPGQPGTDAENGDDETDTDTAEAMQEAAENG